jgi:ABC-type antimicrobial peptide transport system permease subunit
VFSVFDALAIVAVIVAALGIVNTLTMGVVERIREIGILRAIGMTKRQVMRMVVVEAAILGIVGVILGSVAGIGAGALLLELGGGLGAPGGCRGCPSVSRRSWASSCPPSQPSTRRAWRPESRSWSRSTTTDRGNPSGRLGPMTISMPRLDRLPAQERGLTIGDFLVPIRGLRALERPGQRHLALILIGPR